MIFPAVFPKIFPKPYFQAYGGWSFTLSDFLDMGLTNLLDNPKFQQLQDIVDVWVYKEKLLIPKLVICGTGDEFALLDNTR